MGFFSKILETLGFGDAQAATMPRRKPRASIEDR